MFALNLANSENDVEKVKPKKEFSLDSDSEDEDIGGKFNMGYV